MVFQLTDVNGFGVQLNLYHLLEQPTRFRPQKDHQRIVNLVRLPKADKAAILTHGHIDPLEVQADFGYFDGK